MTDPVNHPPRVVRDAERAAIRANIQRLRGILDHMEQELLQEPLTETQTQQFREAWARKFSGSSPSILSSPEPPPPPDDLGVTIHGGWGVLPSVRTARKWWEFWR